MNAKRNDQNPTVDHPFFSAGADPLLHSGGRPPARSNVRLDWRQAAGVALIVGGAISLLVGYVGVSGTKDTYDQLTYFLANGIGGVAAIIVGSTLLIIREHMADRQAMAQLDRRLNAIERRIPAEARQEPRGSETGAHAKNAGQNGAATRAPSASPA